MDLEQELKLLEMIQGLPNAPKLAPMPCVLADDPFFPLFKEIQEYLLRIGYKPVLEEDGRISVDNYLKLLIDLNIPHTSNAVLYITISKP